jgi:hypothetical protein
MPNLLNKKRIKETTQTENESLGSITLGETLPNEYIPSIDLSNYIDADLNLGNPNKTGISNSFTDTSLNFALSNAKIKANHIANNTTEAIAENKIDSNLIKISSSSELGVLLPDNGNYILKDIPTKTDLNLTEAKTSQFVIKTFQGLGTFVSGTPNPETADIQVTYAANTRLVICDFSINLTYSKFQRYIKLDVIPFIFLPDNKTKNISLMVSKTPLQQTNYTISQSADVTILDNFKLEGVGRDINDRRVLSFVHDMTLLSTPELKSTYYYYLVYTASELDNVYRYATKVYATIFYGEPAFDRLIL